MDQERSRHQKIELKETIKATEDAKSHALKELEVIKVIRPKWKVKYCALCSSFTYDNVSVNIDLFS
jgi:hypothetical protein